MSSCLASITHVRMNCHLSALLKSLKGWFGATKTKFIIQPEKLFEILHKNQAGTEVLSNYALKVDDVKLRLKLATKYECHRVVVDTLVQQRDRKELEAYKSRLLPQSSDIFYIQDALKSSTTKWKN